MLLFGIENLIKKHRYYKNVLFKDIQTFFLYSYNKADNKELGHELKFNILSQQVNTTKYGV